MLEVIEETSYGEDDSDLISQIFTEIKKNNTLKRGEIKDLKRIFDVDEFTLTATSQPNTQGKLIIIIIFK